MFHDVFKTTCEKVLQQGTSPSGAQWKAFGYTILRTVLVLEELGFSASRKLLASIFESALRAEDGPMMRLKP